MTKSRGFTLIELLVAIGIIATLTAILLPNFMGARERARDAQRKQDLDAVKSALRLFYNDNESYPVYSTDFHSDGAAFLSGYTPPLTPYMANIGTIGFTFEYRSDVAGDTFQLRYRTETTRADENGASQLKCGIGVGNTDPDYFMICAN
ncbi:MAG: type II secretion system protein [Patescibacteria group bacterium]